MLPHWSDDLPKPSKKQLWVAERTRRKRERARAKREQAREHQQVREIADLRVRAAVARIAAEGFGATAIGEQLGISAAQAAAAKRRSLVRLQEAERRGQVDTVQWIRMAVLRRRRALRDVLLDRPMGTRMTDLVSTRSGTVSGDVLDGPDQAMLQRACLQLKTRAISNDEIGELLGIASEDVAKYIRKEMNRLSREELLDIQEARALQLRQLDAMIEAIYDDATGTTRSGKKKPVIYEAIDRLIKVLDAKAKILGLAAPQKVDIDARLTILADELGADLADVREIASDVLRAYPSGRPGQLRA